MRVLALAAALLAAACGQGDAQRAVPEQPTPAVSAGRVLPRGATSEPSGFPTIRYAEPARLAVPLPRRAPIEGGIGEDWARAIAEAPSAEPFLQIFPVMPRDAGLVPAIALYGRLQLRDGCLRLDPGPGAGEGGLAVFSPGARAFIDPEGYLAIGHAQAGARAPVRVGEELMFGAAPPVSSEPIVSALRKACGPGPIIWVNSPSSHFGFRWAEAARDAPRAAEIHGVGVAVARARMQEELRAIEAIRRRCTLDHDPSCAPRPPRPGEKIDSWLMVWPPPPPPPPQPPPPNPPAGS